VFAWSKLGNKLQYCILKRNQGHSLEAINAHIVKLSLKSLWCGSHTTEFFPPAHPAKVWLTATASVKPVLTSSIPQQFFLLGTISVFKLSQGKSLTLSELQFSHLKVWIKTLTERLVDKHTQMCPREALSRRAVITSDPFLLACSGKLVWRIYAPCGRQSYIQMDMDYHEESNILVIPSPFWVCKKWELKSWWSIAAEGCWSCQWKVKENGEMGHCHLAKRYLMNPHPPRIKGGMQHKMIAWLDR
jgi:hypothetical protein